MLGMCKDSKETRPAGADWENRRSRDGVRGEWALGQVGLASHMNE
jgi:hypothetical protein